MTAPTPDANGNIAPGYYAAEGDPPGLVRYWDGSQWTGGPVPPPPASGGPAAGMGAGASPGGYPAGAGSRFGAIALDGLFMFILIIAFQVIFGDNTTATTSDGGFNFESADQTGFYLGALAYLALTIALVATNGASLGKMILGLRVTGIDGTSPPGWGPSVLRALPWLPTLIPLLGFFVWIAVVITGIVFVSSDPQERSVNDRVGKTFVVKK